ncbi:sugar ABC transporter ATP-binding protein [Sneathiella sp.]|uniref:sugar ABC transporter ATP-binding protein n=1 Tax=Sneathiella sp. TaxID=1964365 RepID=UPI0026324D3B|nr:sugar ABC transporter ATP-binding protein [Sneathiella sp.]MDF2366838.1 sugar ABC transporter ATP-binding protein [Sneathiella sp.]
MTVSSFLKVKNATKTYGGFPAIDAVDFELNPGEIHALVGENGAGKSTLCKVIAGVVLLDGGDITFEDAPFSLKSPRDAFDKGISMVFQETSLVPQLSVAQNMVLGRERLFNSARKLSDECRQLLRSLNFNIDPAMKAGALSAAQKQMVEIARAVYNKSRIIILDEPTAALTPEETDHLFYLMNDLRQKGVAMIFISHALEEALTHADRITVLRNGKKITSGDAGTFDRNSLIRHMVGQDLASETTAKSKIPPASRARKPMLKVENVRMGNMVNNMSFSVFPGEITGIAGLIGSGRSEIAKVIIGQIKRNFGGGHIYLNDKEIRYRLPAQAVQDGIAYVTEDRKVDGFFETMGVFENVSLGWIAKWAKGKFLINRKKLRPKVLELQEKLSIRGIGEFQTVHKLSGGNQQKVVIAKTLIQEPSLVIFDEPTRGVDVGAIAEIRDIIRNIANSGAGVVVISSYLPEILDVSDRILVAKGGTIVAEFSRDEASPEKILHAAIH